MSRHDEIGELARAASGRDLSAARKLVRVLEREEGVVDLSRDSWVRIPAAVLFSAWPDYARRLSRFVFLHPSFEETKPGHEFPEWDFQGWRRPETGGAPA